VAAHEKSNYGKFAAHAAEVDKLFQEEARWSWLVELTDAEAKKRYGEELFIAGLAVIKEPGKIRVVHDGTNGFHVNNRIRPKDQLRYPGAGEIRAMLREKKALG